MPHTRNSGYPPARSARANISEGFGRETHRDFAHFLSISRASLMETDNHLQDAADSGYLSPQEHERLAGLAKRALIATTRLQSYLLRTPDFRRRHSSQRRRPNGK
jgi:four helix bundle protein